jgi:uncharacterized Tic20 family protein
VLAIAAIGVTAAGIQLMKLKQWSPPVIIILSSMMLFVFPIGTLWGAYCIWVLSHKNAKGIFDEQTF